MSILTKRGRGGEGCPGWWNFNLHSFFPLHLFCRLFYDTNSYLTCAGIFSRLFALQEFVLHPTNHFYNGPPLKSIRTQLVKILNPPEGFPIKLRESDGNSTGPLNTRGDGDNEYYYKKSFSENKPNLKTYVKFISWEQCIGLFLLSFLPFSFDTCELLLLYSVKTLKKIPTDVYMLHQYCAIVTASTTNRRVPLMVGSLFRNDHKSPEIQLEKGSIQYYTTFGSQRNYFW